MNFNQLNEQLSGLPLGGLRYFEQLGSTNDEALRWASRGAPDLSLVVADEQTRGRGRPGRRWMTAPGSGLALSLILRPTVEERAHPTRMTGLLALSLGDALLALGLDPQFKWPNDVLLGGRKAAGILVEACWQGQELEALVLGMGVNVLRESVPPPDELLFPAASIEAGLGRPLDRVALLREILSALLRWRPQLATRKFLETWEGRLAYRGQQVEVTINAAEKVTGQLLGLAPDGGLRLDTQADGDITVHFGDVHLRPLA